MTPRARAAVVAGECPVTMTPAERGILEESIEGAIHSAILADRLDRNFAAVEEGLNALAGVKPGGTFEVPFGCGHIGYGQVPYHLSKEQAAVWCAQSIESENLQKCSACAQRARDAVEVQRNALLERMMARWFDSLPPDATREAPPLPGVDP